MSGLVLEHIADLKRFFFESHRVTRPGGRAVISAMHQERLFNQAACPHQFGQFIMAVLHAGFRIEAIDEYAPDAEFAVQYPRAEKYMGWPMLVVFQLHRAKDE